MDTILIRLKKKYLIRSQGFKKASRGPRRGQCDKNPNGQECDCIAFASRGPGHGT